MKETKRKKSLKENGITLIALVVTIVILLILAGVTINMTLGGNGLFIRAQASKAQYENSTANEVEQMNDVTVILEEVAKHNEGEPTATKGNIITKNNATYTDETGTAIIPVGFAVVKDPDKIVNGLVISDKANDDMNNSARGNQFVWIPVEDYSKFHLIEGYSDGNRKSNYLKRTTEAGSSLIAGNPLPINNIAGTEESIAMYKSVKDNKGFYIARFEAGVDRTTEAGRTKPLSQKGVDVFNHVSWGGDNYDDDQYDGGPGDSSKGGAPFLARSMYTKSEICGVTSTLCYGVQWDAVMNFIDSNYVTGTCTNSSPITNNYSAGKGNYTGEIKPTGYYSEKNIYDLGRKCKGMDE